MLCTKNGFKRPLGEKVMVVGNVGESLKNGSKLGDFDPFLAGLDILGLGCWEIVRMDLSGVLMG